MGEPLPLTTRDDVLEQADEFIKALKHYKPATEDEARVLSCQRIELEGAGRVTVAICEACSIEIVFPISFPLLPWEAIYHLSH